MLKSTPQVATLLNVFWCSVLPFANLEQNRAPESQGENEEDLFHFLIFTRYWRPCLLCVPNIVSEIYLGGEEWMGVWIGTAGSENSLLFIFFLSSLFMSYVLQLYFSPITCDHGCCGMQIRWNSVWSATSSKLRENDAFCGQSISGFVYYVTSFTVSRPSSKHLLRLVVLVSGVRSKTSHLVSQLRAPRPSIRASALSPTKGRTCSG